jgi:hypothetical protein
VNDSPGWIATGFACEPAALVMGNAGGMGMADVGKSLDSYDGARIEVLDVDGDDELILPFTETQGNSSVTGSIYCIRPGTDLDGEYVQGLVGSKMIDVTEGGKNGVMFRNVVEMHGGLAVFHGKSAARIKGITAQA